MTEHATNSGAGDFARRVAAVMPEGLRTGAALHTMQVNISRACNLRCKHCHLEAGPGQGGLMSREIMAACLRALGTHPAFHTLDITGGAPEMNPHLPWLIEQAPSGVRVIVRTNLVILGEEGYTHLAEFYRGHGVEVVGSLPFYTAKDTDRQRGAGVFARAIAVLRRLNELGYARVPGLTLNLVYNPAGAFLPPPQAAMEEEYRRRLGAEHGIVFNRLFTLTNNPVGRFAAFLEQSGNMAGYMERLKSAFNAGTVLNMMCRDQISVDWQGRVYDCDFNQALGRTVSGPDEISAWGERMATERPIRLGDHCYACTAGSGSSCGGATA
jgi:radical SAM/Cys-rich protein